MRYLVIEKEYFYNGHSEAAEGEVKKYISDDDMFADLDESKVYDDDLQERTDDDYDTGEYYAQDGYHARQTFLRFIKISEEAAEGLQYILDQYNKIKI